MSYVEWLQIVCVPLAAAVSVVAALIWVLRGPTRKEK